MRIKELIRLWHDNGIPVDIRFKRTGRTTAAHLGDCASIKHRGVIFKVIGIGKNKQEALADVVSILQRSHRIKDDRYHRAAPFRDDGVNVVTLIYDPLVEGDRKEFVLPREITV